MELAIKSAAQLKNVILNIVGSEERTSSTSKKGYVAELKELVEELKAEDKVFFTGPKYGKELHRSYTESDIFIYPSSYENFGQPILEAAAAGLPIISTSVGIASDIVKTGETGFLVKQDEKEISQYINQLRSAQTRKTFGEKILGLVEKNYQWSTIIEKYVQIYRSF